MSDSTKINEREDKVKKNHVKSIFSTLILSVSFSEVAVGNEEFELSYLTQEEHINIDSNSHNSIVSGGMGFHSIKKGDAKGFYLSGITQISDSDFAAYMRGELISDKYKTGHFWSWNIALGLGYYIDEDLVPYVSFGKCFSNYSTCYFNLRHPTQNDDDIDALYYGGGVFFREPVFGNYIELGANWSPYKNYNGTGIFIGYGVGF